MFSRTGFNLSEVFDEYLKDLVLSLPEKVFSDKTQANLIDGIPSISLPKATPTPKPKSNTIRPVNFFFNSRAR